MMQHDAYVFVGGPKHGDREAIRGDVEYRVLEPSRSAWIGGGPFEPGEPAFPTEHLYRPERWMMQRTPDLIVTLRLMVHQSVKTLGLEHRREKDAMRELVHEALMLAEGAEIMRRVPWGTQPVPPRDRRAAQAELGREHPYR